MKLLTFTKRQHIWLYDEVRVKWHDHIVRYVAVAENKQLNLVINSYGGYVEACLQIMTYLNDLKKAGWEINTYASGRAASAAFMIWMMGDNRYADRHVTLMHHKAATHMFTGTVDELVFEKQDLQRLDNALDRLVKKEIKLNAQQKKIFEAGKDVVIRYAEAKKMGLIT